MAERTQGAARAKGAAKAKTPAKGTAKTAAKAPAGQRSTRLARHLRLVPTPRRRSPAEAKRLARRDLALLGASAGALTVVGLVMVLSAGSVSAAQGYGGNSFWYFQRQLVYAALGVGAAVVVARLSPRIWKHLGIWILGGATVLMVIAARPTSGTALYGASRWIDLGPITIQPSEFAKLGLVAVAATILTNKWSKLDEPMQLLMPLGPIVLLVGLLGIAQRDLGTTLILCGLVLVMLFAAGIRMRYLVFAAGAGLLGAMVLIVGETYRRTRFFDAWLNPWADRQGNGYQLIQGLIAIGSGGWLGTGLGTSRAKWDFLPNAHSDFIYAVIGEELGLLGALAVLIAFGVLIYAGIRIAMHARGTFERLLAAGVIGWIGLQAIVNMGAVTGLLPITGVPLPLVSFGGTALVVTLVGVGMLASIARDAAVPPRTARGSAPRR
ncbi:MAG TPA: putative lipid II flippase FtsW [Actinomycetota bacterium]|nr:putative lipid II flippase FtsW [Actinomycetota bacterium]